MKKKISSEDMLQKASEFILFNGYYDSSVKDIMSAVGMGKGSFATYFESKEDMGVKVLENFMTRMLDWQSICLSKKELTPLERIRVFYGELITFFKSELKCTGGCMVGNFSVELSSKSEMFREKADSFFKKFNGRFSECIREGQNLGEIRTDMNHEDIAELLMITWEGSVLRMKTMSNEYALDLFINDFFRLIRKEN